MEVAWHVGLETHPWQGRGKMNKNKKFGLHLCTSAAGVAGHMVLGTRLEGKS